MLRILAMVLLASGVARADDAIGDFVTAGTPCDKARAHCFGIQLHVPKTDAGFIVTPAWVAEQVAQAQQHFAALDVSFELVGADVMPAKTAHLVTRADRNALAKVGLGGRVVHVFLTSQLDDVDVAGATARGVTWRLRGRQEGQTLIIVSGVAKPRTLAHELGHFFGLPHSTYPVSIMNKTDRAEPPPEQRRFADEEIAAMRPFVTSLVKRKILADRKK